MLRLLLLACLISISVSKTLYAVYDNTKNIIITDDGHLAKDPIGIATFDDQINSTGWGHLNVVTYPKYEDEMQAYAAGKLEAVLTRNLITNHWHNSIEGYCTNQKEYCARLRDFLIKNMNMMYDSIVAYPNHQFWHQVKLLLYQLSGLDDGFNEKQIQPNMNVSVDGLMMLQILGDLEDLEIALNKTTELRKQLGSGSCSALIKYVAEQRDIYVAHDTWSTYNSMLRIVKRYKFGFHLNPTSQSSLIPGQIAIFSSYPGVLTSGDDFYMLSSGLVTLETTIGNDNASLYEFITPDDVILEWMRSMIANRLAVDGNSWANIFLLLNSGTYNNQWMIVDYNKFSPVNGIGNGTLTVVEQIPFFTEFRDMSDILREQSYWPSYNVPYFPTIFNASGNWENVKKYGDWFTYDKTPRALIFKRDHGKVKDLESMMKLMRYNDYKNDPYSSCNCTPSYSAENAIAARSDLNPAAGTYPFGALGHRQHGATDAKITSYKLMKSGNFYAVSSPTNDQQPSFQWSKSDFDKDVPHQGLPDLYEFDPILIAFDAFDEFDNESRK